MKTFGGPPFLLQLSVVALVSQGCAFACQSSNSEDINDVGEVNQLDQERCSNTTAERVSAEASRKRLKTPHDECGRYWGSHTHGQRRDRKRQRRSTLRGCECQCRLSDRAKAGRYRSRPCRFQWKHPGSVTSFPSSACCTLRCDLSASGRRCRRLQSNSWNVDSSPNHRGQARRNAQRNPSLAVSLVACHTQKGFGGGSHGLLVDLLLMLECQRQGSAADGRGKYSGPQQFVVSLVTALMAAALLAGDHSGRRREAARQTKKHRLTPPLRRPSSVSWTMRKHKATEISSLSTCTASSCNSSPLSRTHHANPSVCQMDKCKVCSSIWRKELKRCDGQDQDEVHPWILRFFRVPYQVVRLAPATQFLPTALSRDSQYMDHVGYRLASLAALPPSCGVSRVRVAEAGFHYNPSANTSAVLCHRCGAAYGLEPCPSRPGTDPYPSPLTFHQEVSPQCPLLSSMLDRFMLPPPASSALAQAQTVAASTGGGGGGAQQGMPGPSSSRSAPGFSAHSRVGGGSELTDGRDLSEDSEARLPTSRADSPFTEGPQSAPTGYALALPTSNTDQRSQVQQQQRELPPNPFSSSTQGSGFPSRRPDQQTDRPQLALSQAVYPQYTTAQSRLQTFRNWPLAATFPPNSLVEIGFYYAGYADCVRCFYCGVGLKSWDESDNALEEHIRWRPTCDFLLATKGRQFIQRTVNRLNRANSSEDSEPRPPTPSALTQTLDYQTLPPTLPLTTTSTLPGHHGQQANTGSAAQQSFAGAGTSRGQSTVGSPASTGQSALRSPASSGHGTSSASTAGGSLQQAARGDGETSGEETARVRQQLATMGFSAQDVDRARERLRRTGQPDDMNHLLDCLFSLMK